MKICNKCSTENLDTNKYCCNCGAEIDGKKSKITYAEKRAVREQQTQEMLNKSMLSSGDLHALPQISNDCVALKYVGKHNKIFRNNIIKLVACIIAVIVAFCLGMILKYIKGLENFKVLSLMCLFVAGGVAAAFLIDLQFLVRVYASMKKSQFAIKKTTFGKAPIIKWDDSIYELSIISKCSICGNDMHFEEFDGRFIVVCNDNRTHLMEFDTAMVKECIQKLDNKS